ncbi:MAG TPA: hypothetical protein PKK55_02520 [Methanofastidiosum sp.]|jgi:hypothetical protein|nr:hypothetical protein [Methanofastidiosum sp.]HOC78306.1 hypothetical protein [Methanofastidiosum sp.]HOG73781.1 hypothetical protein [Methanofastidiosum sp.]HPA49384.1 hypothetical protein [Methanofastidiosum sp.]HQK62965.1 hypothetical protein [Methanofastidiosum sp.]
MSKDTLKNLRRSILEQKYRFDLGRQFLVYVNFALLIIAASDKIKLVINLSTTELLMVLVPLSFIATYLLGYVLDKFVKFPQASQMVEAKRSPYTLMTQEKLDKILEKLDKI